MLGKTACRIKVAFGGYRVGQTIYPTGVYRDQLKQCGFIELIPDAPEPEPALERAEAPERETATVDGARRRGRPPRHAAVGG
jgi:hypothetical protein